jgi:hypothetical protein
LITKNRLQEGFYYRFYFVHLYSKVRIGEYIFLRGLSMVNYIYSDGLNYFYYDERIVNLSSLLVKKLDIFYWLKCQIIFIIELGILVFFIITTNLLRRFIYANEYMNI